MKECDECEMREGIPETEFSIDDYLRYHQDDGRSVTNGTILINLAEPCCQPERDVLSLQ
jgi:hypothetical protein